jgi:hypothetical protein
MSSQRAPSAAGAAPPVRGRAVTPVVVGAWPAAPGIGAMPVVVPGDGGACTDGGPETGVLVAGGRGVFVA